jgi:hypothetical protein
MNLTGIEELLKTLSVAETARRLGCHKNTIFHYLHNKKIQKLCGIYFIQTANKIKIAYTTNLKQSVKRQQCTQADGAKLLGFIQNGTIRDEFLIQNQFKTQYAHSKWFEISPELHTYIKEHSTMCIDAHANDVPI